MQNKGCSYNTLKHNNMKNFIGQKKRTEKVQKSFNLHFSPPYCDYTAGNGPTYRITADKTFVKIGEAFLPSDSCPDTFTMLQVRIMAALISMNWKTAIVAGISGMTGGMAILGAYLVAEHPACSEMVNNALMTWFLWTTAIGGTFFSCFIGWNFFRSAQNIAKEEMAKHQEQKLLAATAKVDDFDIAPDILVAQKQDETWQAWVDRVELAKTNAGQGVWVVAMSWQDQVAGIWMTPTKAMIFDRTTPPFQKEHWTDSQRICPANATFDGETYPEFFQYVSDFLFYYRKWAPLKKMDVADPGTVGKDWMNMIRAKAPKVAAAAMLLVVMVCGLAAQPASQQVAGIVRGKTTPDDKVEVQYIFDSGKILKRVGDGVTAYKDLLTNLPGYVDRDLGKLIIVTAGNAVIGKADLVGDTQQPKGTPQQPTEGMLRPVRMADSQPGNWTSVRMPDSAEIYSMTDEAVRGIWRVRHASESFARPWWMVVMEFIRAFYPVIALLFTLSWVWAKGSAKEGMYSLHKGSRRVFAWMFLIFGSVLVINQVMIALSNGWGNVELTVLCVVLGGLFYFLFTKLTPDFRPAPGNAPIIRRNYDDTPRIEA